MLDSLANDFARELARFSYDFSHLFGRVRLVDDADFADVAGVIEDAHFAEHALEQDLKILSPATDLSCFQHLFGLRVLQKEVKADQLICGALECLDCYQLHLRVVFQHEILQVGELLE